MAVRFYALGSIDDSRSHIMDDESSEESDELIELPTFNLFRDEIMNNKFGLMSHSTLQTPISDERDYFGSAPLPTMLTNQKIQTNINDLVHATPNQLLKIPNSDATGHAHQIYAQPNSIALARNNFAGSVICANTPIVPPSCDRVVFNQRQNVDFSLGQYPTATVPICKKPCFRVGNSAQSLLQAGEQHFLSQIEMVSQDKPSSNFLKGNQLSLESPLEASSLLDLIQQQLTFVQQKLQVLGGLTSEKDINTELSGFWEGTPVSSQPELNEGPFPTKLLGALNDLEVSGDTDIASFLPDGRRFVILDETRFKKEVLGKHFPGMTKLSSFYRQLHLYDFERKYQPYLQLSSYQHELFRRDAPALAWKMRRRKIKGKSKTRKTTSL